MSHEALKRAFVSPDRDVWVDAARELGRLAQQDEEVLGFIRQCVAEPEQLHRRRHALAALASYHSTSGKEAALTKVWEAAVVKGLGAGATVGQLSALPQMEARFSKWLESQQEDAAAQLKKITGSSAHPKAIEAKQKRVDDLAHLTAQSKLPSGFVDDKRPREAEPWDVASYLVGVCSSEALGGLPLDLLCRGLCLWAEALGPSGLALVVNLPELLTRLPQGPKAEEAKVVLRNMEHHRFSEERLHHARFVSEVAALSGEDFVRSWTKGQVLPDWLAESLTGISSSKGAPRGRAAARLCRQIIDRCFGDDWRFRELDSGERFGLNVFLLLVERGTEPFGGSAKELSPAHRVALLLEALQASHRAREQVLPALVRVLRGLLGQELERAADRDVAQVALRHVALVRPLLVEWKLPGTIRKDLAAVLGSVLQVVLSRSSPEFFAVWYSLLFDFPDEVVFREMIEFCAEPRLTALMEAVLGVFSGKDPRVDYQRYVAALAEVDDQERGLEALVLMLGRAELDGNLGTAATRDLVAILQALEEPQPWSALAAPPSRDRRGARFEAEEHQRVRQRRARLSADQIQHALDEVRVLESECLPEVGRPTPRDDLVRDWRRLIRAMDELTSRCSRNLPCVEAHAVGTLLESRIISIEQRLELLVRVLEREDEAFAAEAIERRLASGDEDASDEDERLVQEWMLSRYMVAELARTHRLTVLRWLTSPAFVFAWFLAPHIACAVLHKAGAHAYRGLPYAVGAASGVLLVAAYFIQARRSRTLTAGAGRFLLPQTSAALFVGLMEVVSADESWSMAVLEYSWVRLFKIAAFLVVGFVFIREVLLRDQLQGRSERRRKSRRAASVMALVLWQAALGVLFFGILFGRIMGARAELGPEFGVVSDTLAGLLPAEVHLGPGLFSLPPADAVAAPYRIFPWALLTWTVQVFFLSAIFERIMGRND